MKNNKQRNNYIKIAVATLSIILSALFFIFVLGEITGLEILTNFDLRYTIYKEGDSYYLFGGDLDGNYFSVAIDETRYFVLSVEMEKHLVIYLDVVHDKVMEVTMNTQELRDFHLKLTGKSLDDFYMEKVGMNFQKWVEYKLQLEPVVKKTMTIQEYFKKLIGKE